MAPAAATSDPHQSVQKRVTFVSSFHVQVDAIFVCIGVDAIRHTGVIDLVQNILGSGQPAVGLHDDVCGGIVGGLEHVARSEMCR